MQTVRFNTGISSIQTSLFLEARSAKVPMMPMVPRLTSLAPESQATPASEEAQRLAPNSFVEKWHSLCQVMITAHAAHQCVAPSFRWLGPGQLFTS